MYDENSFRARSLKNQKNRKKLIRKRILVVSVCIVFVTILICAVWKISEITKSGSREAKKTNSSATVTAKPVKQKETATPVPTPAPTKKPEGKEKWLRKDLDPDKPMIALTFDDGPYSPVTDRIVKTLKKYDSRATFFTVGNRIPSYKSSVVLLTIIAVCPLCPNISFVPGQFVVTIVFSKIVASSKAELNHSILDEHTKTSEFCTYLYGFFVYPTKFTVSSNLFSLINVSRFFLSSPSPTIHSVCKIPSCINFL